MTTSTNNKTITSHKNLALITIGEGVDRAAIALAIAKGIQYEDADALLVEAGVKEAGKPTEASKFQNYLAESGFTSLAAAAHIEHERDKHQLNLNEFIYRHPKGTFIVFIKNGTEYPVAIIDGKVYDTEFKVRAKVTFAATAPGTIVGEDACRCEDMEYLGRCWRQSVRPNPAERPSAKRAKARADQEKALKASNKLASELDKSAAETPAAEGQGTGEVVNASSEVTEIEGADVRGEEPSTAETETSETPEIEAATEEPQGEGGDGESVIGINNSPWLQELAAEQAGEETAVEAVEPQVVADPDVTDAPSAEEDISQAVDESVLPEADESVRVELDGPRDDGRPKGRNKSKNRRK